ncbi:hypothetical protein [Deinococcus roseus]|nr:hypothetical protein [Deinococcus roseus]
MCEHQMDPNLERTKIQLKSLHHPLARAYLIFINSMTPDLEHHKQVVATYLGSSQAPKSPIAELLKHPAHGSLEIEACAFMLFGLGLSLIHLGRIREGAEFLQKAHSFAQVIWMNLISLAVEIELGCIDMIQRDYQAATRKFIQVIQQAKHTPGGQDLQHRAASCIPWVLANPERQEPTMPGKRMLAYILRNLQAPGSTQGSAMPKDHDLLRQHLGLARDLGRQLQQLKMKAIEDTVQLIVALPAPPITHTFSYLICTWIKAHALMHCDSTEQALALVTDEDKLAHPLLRDCETTQVVQALIQMEAQIMLCGREVVLKDDSCVRLVQQFLQAQSTETRMVLVELIAQVFPTLLVFLQQAGCNLPEMNAYLKEQVMVVHETQAIYQGKRVEKYSVIIGATYHELFDLEVDINSWTVQRRVNRHQNALRNLPTHFPIAYEALAGMTLASLRSAGVFPPAKES